MTFNKLITTLFATLLIQSCAMNIEFIAASDPHLNGTAERYEANLKCIENMNSLREIQPQFVWMLGDVTDDCKQKEWEEYTSLYGVSGEGELNYPVMECFGNHDGNIDGIVRNGIKERNKHRAFKIYTDTLGLHYSWDIKGVHFINLNLYPANEWDPNCDWCKYFHESFREAQNSLDFLIEDLRRNVGKSNRPVIIAFHIGYDEFSKLWWTDNDRNNFYNVIKDYNVIAIFQGHNHSVGCTDWNGIPVWAVGSTQNGSAPGTFLMLTTNRKGYLQVKEY